VPRSRFLLGLSAVAATCLAAADASNAVAIFDAYLAHAARTIPEYRADLRPVGPNESDSSGRLLARGPIIGAFTFRPKTYGELNRTERADMLRDPRFRAFLVALRTQADRRPAGLAEHQATLLPRASDVGAALEHFEISPEEMLQRRPMFVVLAWP
jgi:hypothetical protein